MIELTREDLENAERLVSRPQYRVFENSITRSEKKLVNEKIKEAEALKKLVSSKFLEERENAVQLGFTRTGDYDRREPQYFVPIIAALNKSFGSLKQKTFLHVGSGYGLLAAILRDLGAKCVSIDINCLELSKGNKAHTRSRAGKFNPVQANAVELPFRNKKFDGVISDYFLASDYKKLDEQNEQKITQEINRVLKPSGKLLLYRHSPTTNLRTRTTFAKLLMHQQVNYGRIFGLLTILEKA